jgi:hypothetical protein
LDTADISILGFHSEVDHYLEYYYTGQNTNRKGNQRGKTV